MEKTERIGVSLEKGLLTKFDKIISNRDYPSRSEAIRDLIRAEIGRAHLSNPRSKGLAVVSIVYHHHSHKLLQKLTSFQHSHLTQSISSVHIHLDQEKCLEVIVLRGRIADINKIGEQMVSLKGVIEGKVNLISAGL